MQPPKRYLWAACEPTLAVSDSDDDDDDEDDDEQAHAAGEVEQLTYNQAIKSPDASKWNEAMLEKYNAHLVLLEDLTISNFSDLIIGCHEMSNAGYSQRSGNRGIY